jgi:hypothetical protein
MRLRLVAFACGLAFAQQLAGCAGRRPYINELATKNVSIRTITHSGSIFASMKATLDIYSVDTQCRPEYAGTVNLAESSVAVAIATDRWSYLVFDFAGWSLLRGARTRTSHDLFFKPQADHRYEIEVTYQDDIYNVVLSEGQSRGALRELPRLDAASCRAD